MCGIAGIIHKNNAPVTIETLRPMTDVIKHRGPDGEGHYLDGNVGLGHRRLAIIDLSDAGIQPMEKNGLIITYNGEIYNYLELREQLKQKGIVFTTQTDTEVILKAYEVWGESCVQKFNGMWAFAIFEPSKNKLFISRDRFGIKPFYYHESENHFVFGSEIKQILPFLNHRKVNRQALYDFLYLSYQHHNEATFLEGVQSLAPGHNMILETDTGISRTERFYELKKMEFPSEIELEEAVFRYKKAFKRAISFRLRSDVKVGTCLSGGLDSSYVAKVASENYANKEAFTAITAKSLDASNDESHYAKQVVDAYCLNGKVVQPTEADFYNMMDDIIYIQEEPFATPSIFMQYFVMKMAGTEGCIVMLDGQGGDETLLGYERYFVPYLKSIKNPFTFFKQFFKLADNSRLSAKRLFLYYLYFGFGRIREKKVLHKNRHILKENQQYLDRDLSRAFERASGDLFQLQKKELCELQLPKLLKFEDRSSMAHSIEARVPFVDHELVELAVSLPQQHKIYNGWSKYVLRKSFGKNAPQNIVWRKDKFGFEAPTKKWMQDKAYFIDAIKGSGFMDHVVDKSCNFEKLEENALWKLYNVAKWAEMFNVTY